MFSFSLFYESAAGDPGFFFSPEKLLIVINGGTYGAICFFVESTVFCLDITGEGLGIGLDVISMSLVGIGIPLTLNCLGLLVLFLVIELNCISGYSVSDLLLLMGFS